MNQKTESSYSNCWAHENMKYIENAFVRGGVIGLILFWIGVAVGGGGHGLIAPLLLIIGPMSIFRWIADISPSAHNQFAWASMGFSVLVYSCYGAILSRISSHRRRVLFITLIVTMHLISAIIGLNN